MTRPELFKHEVLMMVALVLFHVSDQPLSTIWLIVATLNGVMAAVALFTNE